MNNLTKIWIMILVLALAGLACGLPTVDGSDPVVGAPADSGSSNNGSDDSGEGATDSSGSEAGDTNVDESGTGSDDSPSSDGSDADSSEDSGGAGALAAQDFIDLDDPALYNEPLGVDSYFTVMDYYPIPILRLRSPLAASSLKEDWLSRFDRRFQPVIMGEGAYGSIIEKPVARHYREIP